MQQHSTYLVSKPPKWLWLAPLLSMGLLTPASPIAVAAKAGNRKVWGWAVAIIALWLIGFATVGSTDGEGATSDLGFAFYLTGWIGATVFALVVGPKVQWSPKVVYGMPPPPPPHDPNASAVAGVEAGRRKRHEARELLRRDPSMARDLRIGRPDLPRQYDDGGLVDVNSAPVEVLQGALGLSPEQAARLVEARQHLTRFEHEDDLVGLAGLDPHTVDRVKDRIVLM